MPAKITGKKKDEERERQHPERTRGIAVQGDVSNKKKLRGERSPVTANSSNKLFFGCARSRTAI